MRRKADTALPDEVPRADSAAPPARVSGATSDALMSASSSSKATRSSLGDEMQSELCSTATRRGRPPCRRTTSEARFSALGNSRRQTKKDAGNMKCQFTIKYMIVQTLLNRQIAAPRRTDRTYHEHDFQNDEDQVDVRVEEEV